MPEARKVIQGRNSSGNWPRPRTTTRTTESHATAVTDILARVEAFEPEAVGHRVVHGGEHFHDATLIDDAVVAAIEDCVPLAPLHNPANLAGIPAISLPCGRSNDGLPIGLQLAAGPFEEETIYRAAYAFETATGVHAAAVGERPEQAARNVVEEQRQWMWGAVVKTKAMPERTT